ncbi:KH domain protein [Teladorsagia circumcincta]|uniref:KH domain protein n=1 Tax=Teladorsagia circumcincta TaxID=45464 RepID=A0A2G9UYL4_TELCI|nr:KH domain protein [Teladorsagia circumcincta]
MEPRLAAGRQATERVELTRQGIGRATESAAALADQLVLEFLVMELTEPPAAQLAKTAGDGAQLQFISSMFDRNPILERLAADSSKLRPLWPLHKCLVKKHQQYELRKSRGVKCSYIGRLIGPNGITIRELQLETRCHIAVRGRGSIKDSKLFRKMRHKPGFGHLREDTHVLVEAKGTSRVECRNLIEKAKKRIADMFTPEFDSLKREQLIHLAMLNGTYRQSLPSPRSST